MSNVLREDIVKIGFEIDLAPFQNLLNSFNELQQIAGQEQDIGQSIQQLGEMSSTTGQDIDGLTSSVRRLGQTNIDSLTNGINETNEEADQGSSKAKKLADSLRRLGNIGMSGTLKGLKAVANLSGKAIAALGKGLGKVAKTTAKGIAIGTTAAVTTIGAMGVSAMNVGMEFEASMSQVAATMGMTANEANYTNEEYAMLANTAKEMGGSTKFSASESADALNYLALA